MSWPVKVGRGLKGQRHTSSDKLGGFKQLPLDQVILKKIRTVAKSNDDEHFVVDENSHWMLQGWKGRIIYAFSTWKPNH